MSEVLDKIAQLKVENDTLTTESVQLRANVESLVAQVNRDTETITNLKAMFDLNLADAKKNYGEALSEVEARHLVENKRLSDLLADETERYNKRLAEQDTKYNEDIKRLVEANKTDRDVLSVLFEAKTKTLETNYTANTSRILDSLERANKDRDEAQADADSWKTKFNEYIKSHL